MDPGSQLGPFILEGLIGSGGMGKVYRGRRVADGQLAAIKVLPEEAPRDVAARLIREIRALGQIRDPHVVGYLDADVTHTPHWLAMELIDGQPLDVALAKARAAGVTALPSPRVFLWGEHIARGLAAAHVRGVLHRDLKPANVMIGRDLRAVIVDFGLSRMENADASALTGIGKVVGTLMYLAPEVMLGQPFAASTDVYQWALLVFEMLTGGLPFAERGTLKALQARIASAPTPPPMPDALGDALARLACVCLTPRPEGRPPDAGHLLRILYDLRLG